MLAVSKNGFSTMFYSDGVITFNDEGKISHFEWGMNPDQAANFAKLMD